MSTRLSLLVLLFTHNVLLAAEHGGYLAPCVTQQAGAIYELPATLPASTCSPAPVTQACFDDACAQPRLWFSGDLLYWNAHMRSLDYAASEDGTTLTIGAGQNHRVDFDRNAGLRTELGYMAKVGWGVSVSYTYFSTEGSDSVDRPPGVGQLFSTISHPGGPEEADTASATTSLDFSTFELLGLSLIHI